MTQRMWPAHAAGLALCFVAFVFGYAQFADVCSIGPALYFSLVVPLFGAAMLSPVTFVVVVLCVGLFYAGREFRFRGFLVCGYALPAVYWAWLALMLANAEF